MSILPPDIHASLTQLLQSLQSSDNIARSHAEEQLNNEWVHTRPDMLLMGLVEQMEGSGDATTRSFAAVMFRRMAARTRKDPGEETSIELFMILQKGERDAIQSKVLECLGKEQVAAVRNKVGDAVAEVARQCSDADEPWPEILGALFRASQSPEPGQRETAFRIFAATPDIIESQHEDGVLNAFGKGFKDDDVVVRLAAVEAFSSFFVSINKNAQKKYFKLIGDVLTVLPPLKASKDGDQLVRAFVALIELAETQPKMFRSNFHDLVVFCISVIQDKELDDPARQNAMELMATFADNHPGMCRKDESYTSEMVTQCLSLMTDVGADDDDAEDWNASEDLDIDESDMNHVAGEQCMDRLANKLGGQTLLPPTFNWLPQMMSSTSWRDRHAALMAISAISEGCHDLMVGELDKVLDLVIPALKDPHPRVRWAGCNALGQMSTDFATTMQEKYHSVVLPNILPVLEAPEPRVQSHAAAALVNFCEEAEQSVLEPYLDNLLSRLLTLLQSGKRFVQEQALSTIATVADSAEAAFSRYYDTLMPLLMNVLKEVHDKEYRLLRAKAMECATLIALAVGKDRMGDDATNLVQVLGSIQESITEADDPQSGYLLHCWGRMCRVLGVDFLPYLPGIIPPLMVLAEAKADIQLLEDEEQVAQIDGEEGWELVPLKGKFIGIRTSTLDDKHTAIELIFIYAQKLEGLFEPYVNDIMEKITIPGLAFFFHDPVRVASAKAIPQLLNSCKEAHGAQSPELAQLWAKTSEKVLEVLRTDATIETLAEMYECFYECCEVMGDNCLTDGNMKIFIDSVESVLKDYQQRVSGRAEESAEKDEGEEDTEDTIYAIEDDQTLLSDINKAFHTIAKHQRAMFLPHWEKLMPFYDSFVVAADPNERQWALCIFDDILEFCGPESWHYSPHILKPLADGVQDEEPSNRQAAAYGIGVAAQKGGQQWSEFVAASLPMLFQATKHAQSREDEHVFATENACASIAKILRFNGGHVPNSQDIVNHWVDTLPVVNDEEAAPYAYSFLVELIEKQNPAVARKPAKIFKDVVEALNAETLQGQTAQRTFAAVNTLLSQTGVDPNQALSTLSPELQQAVQKFNSR
ncbi:MAG: hypothetical protein M1828_003731 [Chrysothrix sp. TS-e1954]|nr:MAG: hypothetical protein M1828_003731 [Chrysothrix sp. TS-e1954]